jgi:hypothetical protein
MIILKIIVILTVVVGGQMNSMAPSLPSHEGWLSAYAEGPTVATLEYRYETGDIDEGYDVYLAVLDCSRLSESGVIKYDDGTVETYQVFDCAARDNKDGTQSWMERHNIVAEVDYYTWKRRGRLGRAALYPGAQKEKDELRRGWQVRPI